MRNLSDLIQYIGFFVFSAGLIIIILILPLPNMWTVTEDLIYVASGLFLLGLTIFIGSMMPCLGSAVWRLICCWRNDNNLQREKKKIIHVSPAMKDREVEKLISAVYHNKS